MRGHDSGWIEDIGFVFGFERFDFDFDFGFMEIQEVRGLLRLFLQVEMAGIHGNYILFPRVIQIIHTNRRGGVWRP